MIFPLRTDRRLHHTPYVNIGIIIANVIVFLMQIRGQLTGDPWWGGYQLDPVQPVWYQFFTYQFLHAGWEHLIPNMLFLYVFGNSVEDRFGPLGYGCFYLAGGVMAALGHGMVSQAPILGASGSVSAVTGAFLVLFPQTHVTLLVFIYFVDVPSMYIIGLFFAQDLLFEFMGVGGVAYLAHITGNIYGFVIAMGLLGTRVLAREPYDLLSMLAHWNRRRQFRSVTRGGSPWQREAARRMAGPLTEGETEIMHLRADVLHAMEIHDAGAALASYQRLLEVDPNQVLHRQAQLDLANLAMHAGQYDLAAQAYETFLRHYPTDEFASEVQLILGLVYGRYLEQPQRARPYLREAVKRLGTPARRQMAQDLLDELGDERSPA